MSGKRSYDDYSRDRDSRDRRGGDHGSYSGGGDRRRSRYDDDRRNEDRRRYDDRRGDDRRSGYGGGGHDRDRGGHDDRRGGGGSSYYGGGGGGGSHYGGGGDSHYGPSGGRDDRKGSSYGRGGDDRYGRGDRGGGGSHYGGRDRGGGGGRDRGAYGGGRGGRDRGGGGRGRGRGGPDMSGIQTCLTNIVLAEVTEGFQFYLYSVNARDANGDQLESRHRRKFLFDNGLWDGLLKAMPEKEKNDLRRVVFFRGSFFCTGRPIPGLEPDKLPYKMQVGEGSMGETMEIVQAVHYLAPEELKSVPSKASANEVSFDNRCADCTKAFADHGALVQHCQQNGHRPVYTPDQASCNTAPIPAQMPVFISFINGALQRALGERLARWGSEFIDPTNVSEPEDRNGNKLGVRVYEAFSCQFGCMRPGQGAPGEEIGPGCDQVARLALTVDLRAKIVRTMSVLDHLVGRRDHNAYKPSFNEQESAKREWIGEVVISMHDKKCYSVTDLIFEHSASSMPVEGLGMSHAEYFQQRKGITLKYPDAKPMIAVLGRRNQTIHLPAELVAGNELERRVKEQLPKIASYPPDARNAAIEKIKKYLIPGAQKTKGTGGLLPSMGVQIKKDRLSAKAKVLPLPMMVAAGVEVPKHKAENWAPMLNRATFNVSPSDANSLNVIVVYHERLEAGARKVYNQIRDLVNNYQATYRFGTEAFKMVRAGDKERHWGAVENCFADPSNRTDNIFVLDFSKPRGATDPAYPVVKQMLTSNGYVSQFVNFNTYAHDNPRDQRRSNIILQGCARQILQKVGVRLWWVNIPRTLPTPTVFVGVDVFHAPRVYDPVAQKRVAKASCAAIIVQVYRSASQRSATIELYSETYAREAGKEYDLRDALRATVSTALKELDCDPKSCIVWRDGIGDSAFSSAASEEIKGISEGLNQRGRHVPMSYVVCQKRIDTKFFSKGVEGHADGKFAAPAGTLIQGIQGMSNQTFYINGRAPPYSTAKPVRFIVVRKDDELKEVSLPELTWDMCHDYPNWTGPIKVPSVCQMAHKLAELGGNFADCGRNIDNTALKNTVHFL